MDWKKIPKTNYLVNKIGQVKNVNTQHILKPQKQNYGYVSYGMRDLDAGKYKTYLGHRLVGKAFIPNPENKKFINHKDGDKTNNHISNLEWCTRQENETHAFATGLKNSTGINNTQAKMDAEKVKDIRENCTDYLGDYKAFGKKYNVHSETIRRIYLKQTWKHI